MRHSPNARPETLIRSKRGVKLSLSMPPPAGYNYYHGNSGDWHKWVRGWGLRALTALARASCHRYISRRPPRAHATDRALAHDFARAAPELGAFDVVIHAAALSAPWGRPAAFDAAKVNGTRHTLALAARSGARFFLISSSSVLYASGNQQGLPEAPAPDTPPVNDYARTKRAAETLTAAYPGD